MKKNLLCCCGLGAAGAHGHGAEAAFHSGVHPLSDGGGGGSRRSSGATGGPFPPLSASAAESGGRSDQLIEQRVEVKAI